MGDLYWYLLVYGLISMLLFFGCLQKNTRCVMEEEDFEDLKD
jgi:hypothetical protein